mmetsp:Transcript_68864/g.150509  ORF Transcript_68864/g.150509 Transcript_68864/m.150509 type:complete len:227 (+) Transcript_68864:331-1011(+)
MWYSEARAKRSGNGRSSSQSHGRPHGWHSRHGHGWRHGRRHGHASSSISKCPARRLELCQPKLQEPLPEFRVRQQNALSDLWAGEATSAAAACDDAATAAAAADEPDGHGLPSDGHVSISRAGLRWLWRLWNDAGRPKWIWLWWRMWMRRLQRLYVHDDATGLHGWHGRHGLRHHGFWERDGLWNRHGLWKWHGLHGCWNGLRHQHGLWRRYGLWRYGLRQRHGLW